MQEIQNQIDALTQRIIELENKPVVPGPRGPAGPIEVAIHNAELAAKKVIDEAAARNQVHIAQLTKQVVTLQQLVRDQKAEFEKAVQDKEAEFEKRVEEQVSYLRKFMTAQVTGSVVDILHDYHLLEDSAPSAKYMLHQIKDYVESGFKYPFTKSGDQPTGGTNV